MGQTAAICLGDEHEFGRTTAASIARPPRAARLAISQGIRRHGTPGYLAAMTDSIRTLYDAVRAAEDQDPGSSRTARLLQAGPRKIAKKVAEEAAEVALEAAAGNRDEVIRESADLLYHLVVLWFEAGVQPKDVWAEMDRREKLYGIAEKIAKNPVFEAKRGSQPVQLDRVRRRRIR
jgi:phosphoribosyl-ATP pyrophosphohydrolase